MESQLSGQGIPIRLTGDCCVLVPVAAAAAAPAAAAPAAAAPAAAELLLLPSSWWLLPWLLNRFSRHFFFAYAPGGGREPGLATSSLNLINYLAYRGDF